MGRFGALSGGVAVCEEMLLVDGMGSIRLDRFAGLPSRLRCPYGFVLVEVGGALAMVVGPVARGCSSRSGLRLSVRGCLSVGLLRLLLLPSFSSAEGERARFMRYYSCTNKFRPTEIYKCLDEVWICVVMRDEREKKRYEERALTATRLDTA